MQTPISSNVAPIRGAASLQAAKARVSTAMRLPIATLMLTLSLAGGHSALAHAQGCPFDDGNSSLEVEGLILTRYALGITGAPLVASTGINAVDAPTVEAAINCPSCGLNITGNPTMTVADATIISRKLAGFSGSSLTEGLALGAGTRSTPAAVQSFLLAGCGATGGTVTSITAGTGLTGGVISSSGTIAVDTNFLQRRVSSTCSAGTFITAIAANGTVTCAANAAITSINLRPPFRINATLGPAASGKYSSMVIGVDGLPLIAFYNQGTADLQIAKCTTIDCESAIISTLDSAGDVGQFPSLAIGSDGLGVMSYFDATNGALKLAKCNDIDCSTAILKVVDSTNNSGKFSSLVVGGPLNLSPKIAYFDETSADLKYARCNDGTCSSPTIETVATTGNVGQWAALTLVQSQAPNIAFYDATSRTLNVAACTGAFGSCTSSVITGIETAPVGSTLDGIAISTGLDGFAVMSYEVKVTATGSGSGRIAICTNQNCTTSVVRTGFPGGNTASVGSFTSISVGPDGLPLAMFNGAVGGGSCESAGSTGNPSVLVKCLTSDCATVARTQSEDVFLISPTLTHGIDGLPLIAGRKCSPGVSRLATIHCSNASCFGRFRPR